MSLPPVQSPPQPPPPRPRAPARGPLIGPFGEDLLDERSRRRDLITGGFALLLAFLTHTSLLWLTPDDFFSVGKLLTATDPEKREISVTFDPLPEPDPANQQYVETNPDKPSNRPDETDNVSDRDQQAAQEEAAAQRDPDNRPRVEGEETDSNKIVAGDMTEEPTPYEPPPGAEAAPEAEPSPPQVAGAPPPAPSAPEFVTPNPEVDEGLGSFLRPDPTPVTDPARGREIPAVLNPELSSPEDQSRDATEAAQPAPQGQDRTTPRPRPRLTPQVIAGPLMQNFLGAEDVGAVGVEAYHSDMGDYMKEVLGHIYLQWINSVRETFRTSASGTGVVRVEFWINSEGEVSDASVLNTSAPQINTLLARDAVVARAPYRPWTEDMKKVLGDRQPVIIRFHYR